MQARGVVAKAAGEVRDDLAIGFVRVGLLHDARAIVAGRAPDHVDGGVRDFVRLEEVRAGEPATRISFDEEFQGHGVLAQSTLVLDAEEKPRSRTSSARVQEGIVVDETEAYSVVEYDVPVDESQFALSSPQ
jgi:hypothetical protein